MTSNAPNPNTTNGDHTSCFIEHLQCSYILGWLQGPSYIH